MHIFEGSGLCASSWKLLQAYPRNADNPVLYPGAERTLTDGTYSATARENSVQHITAGNYLVKAVKETLIWKSKIPMGIPCSWRKLLMLQLM